MIPKKSNITLIRSQRTEFLKTGIEIKCGDFILEEFDATKQIKDVVFTKRNVLAAKNEKERACGKKRRRPSS